MSDLNTAEILKKLTSGTAKVLSEKELTEKLELGRPLRVKLGVDPTAPDIHLGHTVAIEKLRQFQELGHTAVLLIGDFTATVGDPTGRSTARPPITRDEVLANAKTYTDQAFKILDPEKTEVVYNGDWFRKMTYEEILKLNSRVTLQQMLQREDFKKRIAEGTEVRLHEIQYPIMQGWDSVMVRADVELGGTDQLFNNLVGRDMQKEEGMPQQVVILMPLLEGLDGVKKMSKSSHNYIGVNEPATAMVDKIMGISDELMYKYYRMLLGETCDPAKDPREAKLELARSIATRYHNAEEADKAVQISRDRSSGNIAAGATEQSLASLPENLTVLSLASAVFESAFNLNKSNGELKKQSIMPGAVQLNGEKLTDPTAAISPKADDVLRLSKKHIVKFID
jgi:tyrosyl-tRNA synthetase